MTFNRDAETFSDNFLVRTDTDSVFGRIIAIFAVLKSSMYTIALAIWENRY